MYLFTRVDRFTKWPEAALLADMSTESCTRPGLNVSACLLPSPKTRVVGGGGGGWSLFTTSLWLMMAQLLHTTVYHPWSNSLVKHFHQYLKSALMAHLQGQVCVDKLLWVVLGIGMAPIEDLAMSSAELAHGTPMTFPGKFVPAACGTETHTGVLTILQEKIGTLAPVPTLCHGPTPSFVPKGPQECNYAFICRGMHWIPLQWPYKGPYKVVRQKGTTLILDLSGHVEIFTIYCLKLAHLDLEHPVTVPPPRRRGQPPKRAKEVLVVDSTSPNASGGSSTQQAIG
ncbi:uncharacterized protein [Narcine bancroftii]|uniref:uncharacterized protein n=1 Tax=Narcine bancroftii TaxID=1343680 RepID=UPI003831AFFB